MKTDSEILGQMCSYFEKLYQSKNIDDNEKDAYLNDSNIPQLNPTEKDTCDIFPTIEECKEAVFNMKPNKSPGLDGLTGEFYKCFWDDISELFYDALIEIFQSGELSFSQRLSVLTLIHKKDDKKLLKNYRPFSLTNTDYKIIAFIFARRLQNIINKIINPNQSAYIRGGYIGSNARLILDIYEYCENFYEDGILLFLDFEKAFDSIEWNFLYKTLSKFNFGKNFIKWVKILYTNPIFHTKNNGWLSKTVNMQRGIRQGCPVSALLYILVAEVLAIKIKENNNISGFSLPNMMHEIKSVQHADDLTMILKNVASLRHGLETIKSFCLHAGSKINIGKTECILLGSLKDTFNEIDGIKVNNSYVKCLGIYIGHDKEECYNKNWMKVYDNMEKLFESWKRRKLTIFGKCCVVNTLALSKLIYVGTVLNFPTNEYLKRINRLIFNFIWNKTDRIKRNSLIAPIVEGGIDIVDIETKLKALKASWVNRLIDKNCINRIFVNELLKNNNLSIDFVLKATETDLKEFKMIHVLPKFYQEIFTSFNFCKKKNKSFSQYSSNEILHEPIWNNSLFRYKNKTFFFENWTKGHILYVKDLFDVNGSFKSLDDFSDSILIKNNWLCEYFILKNVFSKLKQYFDLSNAIYTNIKTNMIFNLQSGRHSIIDKRCKFFYCILLQKKIQKPCYQNVLSKDFNIADKTIWRNVYCTKIKLVDDPIVAEFNYKLLNNLLNNRLYLSKWKNTSPFCNMCPGIIENTRHLIFQCANVQNIWKILGVIINFDIQWKHVVIGFCLESNEKVSILNNILSFIACRIYKFKMFCRLESIDETEYAIR